MVEDAIQDAVHDIVGGLSRATAHPPYFFRIAGRPPVRKKGRPRSTESAFVALVCRNHFEQITGLRATVDTDQTNKPYGHFFCLVVEIFKALELTDDPETRGGWLRRDSVSPSISGTSAG
jgi:hypothetical protein